MNTNLFRILTVLSVIFVVLAVFSFWVSDSIYNTANFTAVTEKTFKDPKVQEAISAKIVDRALQDRPLLRQAVGDYLQSFVSGLLASDAASNLLVKTSERLHEYLLKDNRADVELEIGSFVQTLKPILVVVNPSLAEQLANDLPSSIVVVQSNTVPNLNEWFSPIVTYGPIVGTIGVILAIPIVYFERTKGLKRLGIYLLVASAVFMLIVPYFRMILSSKVIDPDNSTVVLSLYDNFTSSLIKELIFLIFIGILLFILGMIMPKISLYLKQRNRE